VIKAELPEIKIVMLTTGGRRGPVRSVKSGAAPTAQESGAHELFDYLAGLGRGEAPYRASFQPPAGRVLPTRRMCSTSVPRGLPGAPRPELTPRSARVLAWSLVAFA